MLSRVMSGLVSDARAHLVEDCAAAIERRGWPDASVIKRIADEAKQRPRSVEGAVGLELRGILRRTLWKAPPLVVALILRQMYGESRVVALDTLYDAIGVRRDAGEVLEGEFERTSEPHLFAAGVALALQTLGRDELLLLLETIAALGEPPWRRPAQTEAARLMETVTAEAFVAASPPLAELTTSGTHVDAESAANSGAASTEPELPPGVDDLVEGIDVATLALAGASTGAPSESAMLRETGEMSEPQTVGFTPLDRVIVRTIVGTLNRMPGALTIEELDDLVDEMTVLNDARQRSAYHRGFLDALVGRSQRPRQGGDDDERRAWYLTGHLVGQFRQRADDVVLGAFDAMPRQDREVLVRKPSEAGSELVCHMVPRLLDAGRLDDAVNWLRTHVASSLAVTVEVLAWVERHLVDGDTEGCGELIRLCRDALSSAASRRTLRPPLIDEVELRRLVARALSLEGLVLRLQRNFAAAVRCYEAAIEQHDLADLADQPNRPDQPDEASEPDQAAGAGKDDKPVAADGTLSFGASAAAGGLALARLSIGDLHEVRLRARGDRQAQRDAIAGVAHLLERVAASKHPWPPALVVKAMPIVMDRSATGRELHAATAALQRAAELMSVSDRPIWSRSGLRERCRLYLAFAILRQLDSQTAGPAAERVADLLRGGVDAPDELWEMALENASAAGVPAAADIAMALFDRDPGGTMRSSDLPRLAAHAGFRRNLRLRFESVDGVELAPSEKAHLLEHVLGGSVALATRDLAIAEWAIGEIDVLAMQDSAVAQRLLHLLEDRANWEGAVDERDCVQLRVRHLDRLGRAAELGELLQAQLHQAISADETALARDLVDWLGDLHLDAAIAAVRPRLEAQEREQQRRRERRPPDHAAVTIGFVGGNETQRQYEEELRRRLARRVPNLTVWFEFPGWSSNWGAVADRLQRRLVDADAIVLMPMVRTELGRRIRKAASETRTPWIACTGRGCESLARSLFQAVDVVQRQRASGRADGDDS